MKVLVVGNGGREHALGLGLATSNMAPELIFAPGNPGTREVGRNEPVELTDMAALCALARQEKVDLVIPGPEAVLSRGLADGLARFGIPCCGPRQKPAQLEASKVFARQLCADLAVSQPTFVVAHTPDELTAALKVWRGNTPVVKADGLAAGKGVFLPDTMAECEAIGREMLAGSLGDAGRTVLLEERIHGHEASLFYACAGTAAVALPHAQDHKRLLDDDAGPNTGGMGAVSPNPLITPQLQEQVLRRMVQPVLRALDQAGTPFCGFLFVGVMLTERGPQLLEFNVRLGDPEAQVIVPRLQPGELLRLCLATAQGRLGDDFALAVDPRPTCAVVITAANYPGQPRLGDVITVQPQLVDSQRWFIHAGTRLNAGTLTTAGGRVAAIVARADSAEHARAHAYDGVNRVEFAGMHYRHDIGRGGQRNDNACVTPRSLQEQHHDQPL